MKTKKRERKEASKKVYIKMLRKIRTDRTLNPKGTKTFDSDRNPFF